MKIIVLLIAKRIKIKEMMTQRERERETKISQLRQRIQELENMSSRTSEQEQELKDKKAELAGLEQQQTQEPKKNKYLPWIIGGVILVGIVGVIAYLLTRKKAKKDHDEYDNN